MTLAVQCSLTVICTRFENETGRKTKRVRVQYFRRPVGYCEDFSVKFQRKDVQRHVSPKATGSFRMLPPSFAFAETHSRALSKIHFKQPLHELKSMRSIVG